MDLEDSMAKAKDTFITRGGWWVVAQFGLLAGVLGVSFIELPFAKWPFEAHRWVGAALLTMGVIQLGKAALDLGHSLTPMPKPIDQSTLKTTGIYRLVRHPIYGGLMMLCCGFDMAQPSIGAMLPAICLILLLIHKARLEEVWLRERYPEYNDYAQRTRKFLIGLW